MPIKIYNSLTRKKEEFLPLEEGRVKMYVCGPTVYDEPHIGHIRSAYVFDVIRRYLICRGYKVTFVRNVTDVDDKIIDKARKELEGADLNEAARKISVKYLGSYHKAVDSFGIMRPDYEPKATEYIEKMKAFIQVLIKRGAAYEAGGDVYFDIKKAPDYGKLSHQDPEKMEAGSRIAPGENKKDPLDFALWKRAKEGEPSWDSPWGKGRPGWHIECSAMSSDILGPAFDIHGGGLDLIFPHHENEVAQSEGAGNAFAKYWIHHGLLTINGQKMAKSLGNFVTVDDFIARYKEPDFLKLLFLSAHYSHAIDYTDEKIKEAKKQRDVFNEFFDKVNFWRPKEGKIKTPVTPEDMAKINVLCARFTDVMDDDFNMPQGLAVIFELVDLSSGFISAGKEDAFKYTKEKAEGFFNIFGLALRPLKEIPIEVDKKLKERESARKQKKFSEADAIRIEVEKKYNISVIDTATGSTMRFIGM